MKMQKRKFRIGELAQLLNVERFVIRFWEKEFSLRATRSDGGQRFYDEKDLDKFKFIKELLYQRKFTIAGARQQLKNKGMSCPETTIVASQKISSESIEQTQKKNEKEGIEEQILQLQKQLLKLRELL